MKALIDLQQVNLRIRDLQERTKAIPREIEVLQSRLEESRSKLEEAEARLRGHESERRRGEGDVELLRERLSKFRTQLMEVKTNKEYQAVLKEIAVTEEEISGAEDRILESMLEADERVREVKLAADELDQRKQEIGSQCTVLEADAETAAAHISELEQQRQILWSSLNPELRDLYDRIASVRSGTALAEAKDQSCQVCHVKLRPQLFNEIKQNRNIITCENCNRILYYAQE